MLEAYFLLLTLGTLAAFIVWEGIRNRRTSVKPLSGASLKGGFVPGAKSAERVCAIFAATTAMLGALLIAQPQHPPFAGRGALLSSLLYSWFGVWGQPLFCWLLACVLVAGAVGARNKRLGARHAG